MTTYRDILARRGIRPMRVEESTKAHGDLVLDSWCRPVRVYGSTGSGAAAFISAVRQFIQEQNNADV